MNAITIEHVAVAELPQAWRDRLGQLADARVTVRIEAEQAIGTPGNSDIANNPLFGMWSDREDMANVAAYIHHIRVPRFGAGGPPAVR
jgi:hypothetical protein